MKNSFCLKTWAPAACVAALCGQDLIAADLIQLGPVRDDWSGRFTKVSSDGTAASITFGPSNVALPGVQGYHWDAANGARDVTSPGGGPDSSEAFGISGNGNVVVGAQYTESNARTAFRWTASGGIMALSDLTGKMTEGTAYGASWDGGVIVGTSTADLSQQAFKWTETDGTAFLPGPAGTLGSAANAVSDDGESIVGAIIRRDGAELEKLAVIWNSTGVVVLNDQPGDFDFSEALAVSANGETVVGWSYGFLGPEAFRWTEDTGLVALGDLPAGFSGSRALAVSGDGEIVVGSWITPAGLEAFVWDEAHGQRSLASMLQEQGMDITGLRFSEASGISADGSSISGIMDTGVEGSKAFIISGLTIIPEPSAAGLAGLALGAAMLRRRRGRA